jgi:voltage-gated potassium channel
MVSRSTFKPGVSVILKLAALWIALFFLPFTERTLLGARTYYDLIAFLLWFFLICCVLAIFAIEYYLLPHTLDPSIAPNRPLIDYLYFEIMTFTTVGYGDIVPHSAQGKLLAICTALLGATHGVTFVALVLQALTQHSPAKSQE